MEFVLKHLCQQLKLCMPHRPAFDNHLTSLGHTIFRDNCVDGICLENRCQQLCILTTSLPPDGALPPKGFLSVPTISCLSTMSTLPSRSLPTELSPNYFPHFPVRPQCPRFHLAPSHGATKLSQSYFLRSPVCPQCPQFRLAPSQRSSPQPISHGFLSVHEIHASVSLPPNSLNGHLPRLFPHCFLFTLPSRSLPTKLSPSYFPLLGQRGNLWRGHLLVPRTVWRWEVHVIHVILAG